MSTDAHLPWLSTATLPSAGKRGAIRWTTPPEPTNPPRQRRDRGVGRGGCWRCRTWRAPGPRALLTEVDFHHLHPAAVAAPGPDAGEPPGVSGLPVLLEVGSIARRHQPLQIVEVQRTCVTGMILALLGYFRSPDDRVHRIVEHLRSADGRRRLELRAPQGRDARILPYYDLRPGRTS